MGLNGEFQMEIYGIEWEIINNYNWKIYNCTYDDIGLRGESMNDVK